MRTLLERLIPEQCLDCAALEEELVIANTPQGLRCIEGRLEEHFRYQHLTDDLFDYS